MTQPVSPFPVQPELTAIAIGFRNRRLVADQVMPRVVVGKTVFKWTLFNLVDGFTVPDTKVGRTSQPNQVEMGGSEQTGATEDFGLEDPIPLSDIEQAPPGRNLQMDAAQWLTNLVLLDREIRVAGKVFNTANYAAANIKDLAAGEKFSNADSDPLTLLTDAMDAMIMRPNVMVIGRKAFSALARHPKIVKAYHGNDGGSGIVPAKFIADQFELEELVVGEAILNTAKKGKTPVLARAWGNHCALHYREIAAGQGKGPTWGYTAQYGSRVSGSIKDDNIGLRGGVKVRVGESVAEVVSAPDLGYLLQNCIA
ncbi:MAG: major capsid protein [Magnetococcales bacterium]|nr:major capsid protein [Magnetococcales bacterium]